MWRRSASWPTRGSWPSWRLRRRTRGWDGFFVWDHVAYRAPVRAVADPWVALAAVACATSRVRIGPMVTPVSRRRVHKLARETVTLDLLSSGRLTFGVGLGSAQERRASSRSARSSIPANGPGCSTRASTIWPATGPGSSSRSRCSSPGSRSGWRREWPNRRPVRRALRWDGLFPIGLPGPEALAELVGEIGESRPAGDPFDVVVDARAGRRPGSVGAGRRNLDRHRRRQPPRPGPGARGHRRGARRADRASRPT